MSAPKRQAPAHSVWDARPSVRDGQRPRNSACPWTCMRDRMIVSLQTVEDHVPATWCRQCEQILTCAQWLALVEDAAS